MKHYTSTIPLNLAEKLKAAGMPMMSCLNITQTGSFSDDGGIRFYYLPSYAETFDWFESKYIGIGIKPHWSGIVYRGYDWQVCQFNKSVTPYFDAAYGTWHEAATKAIEKALELIKP